jgi:hypothetical protein
MPIIQSEHKAHAATCLNSEMTRQGAVSAAVAAGGSNAVVLAAIKAAEVTFYRAVISSCVANSLPSANFGQALRDLGTGGS